MIFVVNSQNLTLGLWVFGGITIAAPNQPAERLVNRSDRIAVKAGSNIMSSF